MSQANNPSSDEELSQAIKLDERRFAIGVAGFLVIVGMTAWVGYYAARQNTSKLPKNTEIQANGQTAEVMRSPDPSVTLKSYTVEILNGSGVTGAAASAAANLKLQMTNDRLEVTTGNAPIQKGTSISYQNESSRRNRLGGVMAEVYPDARITVDPTLEHSIKIIIGK